MNFTDSEMNITFNRTDEVLFNTPIENTAELNEGSVEIVNTTSKTLLDILGPTFKNAENDTIVGDRSNILTSEHVDDATTVADQLTDDATTVDITTSKPVDDVTTVDITTSKPVDDVTTVDYQIADGVTTVADQLTDDITTVNILTSEPVDGATTVADQLTDDATTVAGQLTDDVTTVAGQLTDDVTTVADQLTDDATTVDITTSKPVDVVTTVADQLTDDATTVADQLTDDVTTVDITTSKPVDDVTTVDYQLADTATNSSIIETTTQLADTLIKSSTDTVKSTDSNETMIDLKNTDVINTPTPVFEDIVTHLIKKQANDLDLTAENITEITDAIINNFTEEDFLNTTTPLPDLIVPVNDADDDLAQLFFNVIYKKIADYLKNEKSIGFNNEHHMPKEEADIDNPLKEIGNNYFDDDFLNGVEIDDDHFDVKFDSDEAHIHIDPILFNDVHDGIKNVITDGSDSKITENLLGSILSLLFIMLLVIFSFFAGKKIRPILKKRKNRSKEKETEDIEMN